MFASPPTDDFDHRLAKALDHAVRVRFLELLAEHGSLSPAQALPLLRTPAVRPQHLSYHVGVLHQLRLVGRTGHRAADGGVPFRLTPRGEAALAMLGLSPSEEDLGS